MTITVTNAQTEAPVSPARVARLARCAVRHLKIQGQGTLAITLVDARRMRALNRKFLAHDRTTDVLSFRYDGERIVGDILVAPAVARQYARTHGLAYAEELSRYVIHGMLHWLGEEDRTTRQQARMRALEDRLLSACGHNGHPYR